MADPKRELEVLKQLQEANGRAIRLLEEAHELQAIYQSLGAEPPDSLKRMLGQLPNAANTAQVPMFPASDAIPPPPRPSAPSQARPDWLWIADEDAALKSVIVSQLLKEKEPIAPKDLVSKLQSRPGRAKLSPYTISNLGGDLEKEGRIVRNGRWRAVEGAPALIEFKGYLWGPLDIFEEAERAGFRRIAIRHVIRQIETDKGTVIHHVLRTRCPWLPKEIPLSEELIRIDLRIMHKDGQLRKVDGINPRWEVRIDS